MAPRVTAPTIEEKIRELIDSAVAFAERYYLHASAEAVGLFVVFTHDVSKAETAIATLVPLAVASVIKRIKNLLDLA